MRRVFRGDASKYEIVPEMNESEGNLLEDPQPHKRARSFDEDGFVAETSSPTDGSEPPSTKKRKSSDDEAPSFDGAPSVPDNGKINIETDQQGEKGDTVQPTNQSHNDEPSSEAIGARHGSVEDADDDIIIIAHENGTKDVDMSADDELVLGGIWPDATQATQAPRDPSPAPNTHDSLAKEQTIVPPGSTKDPSAQKPEEQQLPTSPVEFPVTNAEHLALSSSSSIPNERLDESTSVVAPPSDLEARVLRLEAKLAKRDSQFNALLIGMGQLTDRIIKRETEIADQKQEIVALKSNYTVLESKLVAVMQEIINIKGGPLVLAGVPAPQMPPPSNTVNTRSVSWIPKGSPVAVPTHGARLPPQHPLQPRPLLPPKTPVPVIDLSRENTAAPISAPQQLPLSTMTKPHIDSTISAKCSDESVRLATFFYERYIAGGGAIAQASLENRYMGIYAFVNAMLNLLHRYANERGKRSRPLLLVTAPEQIGGWQSFLTTMTTGHHLPRKLQVVVDASWEIADEAELVVIPLSILGALLKKLIARRYAAIIVDDASAALKYMANVYQSLKLVKSTRRFLIKYDKISESSIPELWEFVSFVDPHVFNKPDEFKRVFGQIKSSGASATDPLVKKHIELLRKIARELPDPAMSSSSSSMLPNPHASAPAPTAPSASPKYPPTKILIPGNAKKHGYNGYNPGTPLAKLSFKQTLPALPHRTEKVLICYPTTMESSAYDKLYAHPDFGIVRQMLAKCYCKSGQILAHCHGDKLSATEKENFALRLGQLSKLLTYLGLILPENLSEEEKPVYRHCMTKQDDDEVRLLASLHKYSLISCRLDALVKALNQCVKSKIKAVIFCYDMLLRNSIESMLKHLKFMFLTLEGATNVQQATVDKFNETPLITALLVCAPQVSVQSIHIKSKTEVFVVDAPLWPPDTFPPHFSILMGEVQDFHRLLLYNTVEKSIYMPEKIVPRTPPPPNIDQAAPPRPGIGSYAPNLHLPVVHTNPPTSNPQPGVSYPGSRNVTSAAHRSITPTIPPPRPPVVHDPVHVLRLADAHEHEADLLIQQYLGNNSERASPVVSTPVSRASPRPVILTTDAQRSTLPLPPPVDSSTSTAQTSPRAVQFRVLDPSNPRQLPRSPAQQSSSSSRPQDMTQVPQQPPAEPSNDDSMEPINALLNTFASIP